VLLDPGTTKRARGAGSGSSATGDLAELVARAEQAFQAKDYDGARAAAEQAAGQQPHNAIVHLLLGRVHLAQGRGSVAAEELRRALRLDPLLPAAHRQLGYALIAIGRFGEALESWEQWEKLADRGEGERAQLPDVQRARDAARVFLSMAAGTSHG